MKPKSLLGELRILLWLSKCYQDSALICLLASFNIENEILFDIIWKERHEKI